RLGEPERQTVSVEQDRDRMLHRLVVDTEDEIAEDGSQVVLLVSEELGRQRRVARLRREPNLQAFDAARQERERRVADPIELLDGARQDLRESRLALAPRPQR